MAHNKLILYQESTVFLRVVEETATEKPPNGYARKAW